MIAASQGEAAATADGKRTRAEVAEVADDGRAEAGAVASVGQKRRRSAESKWDDDGDDDGNDSGNGDDDGDGGGSSGSNNGVTLLEAASQGEATAVAAGEVLKKKKKGRRGKGSHDAKEMKQTLQRRVAGSDT